MKIRRRKGGLGLNEPLRHPDHSRPVTRRDFLSQGFITGAATVAGFSAFSLFANPRAAQAALASDIQALKASCGITAGAGLIPFVAFDLAGGANIAGSNVLVGQAGGQMDFLSTAGYSKLGLPGNMNPNSSVGTGSFIDTSLGLAFHSDSAQLRGILASTKTAPNTPIVGVSGAVIPARSENDTGTNPHNPMYGIYTAGAKGELLTLIGTESSDSGGNSAAPSYMMDATVRPTKVDRASDVTGLVDTGKLVGLLSQDDATAVLESIERLSKNKLDAINTNVSADAVIKDLVQCGYVKSAYLADQFGNALTALNPDLDAQIVGPSGIFTAAEYAGSSDFRATAAVMKMVINGYAGAGTIEMGGFDYHTGDRSTGELRDANAGRCIGAVLEYARRMASPVMIYVFSDGSLSSNGMIDNSTDGRGKGVWTGDNQSTAASYFLVYNPLGAITPITTQIGSYNASGDINNSSSPAANAVNLLAETVVLNYLALHGRQGEFANLKWANGTGTSLGSGAALDALIAMPPLR